MPSAATIGPYRILHQLGGGGMGVVYRAEHTTTKEWVALKTVRLPASWLLAGIRREIKALARLSHPGIVRIVEDGVDEGIPWYAMELVPGTPLRRYPGWASDEEIGSNLTVLERGPGEKAPGRQSRGTKHLARKGSLGGSLPDTVTQGLSIIRRLCTTLAYLHGRGLVHGDLKPDNVVVRPDGMPVVVDFGVASRFQGEVARESLSNLLPGMGTLAYMAPEQIRRQPIDARADLYSLGCMLYELVCGRPPFLGEALSVATKHLHTRPKLPTTPAGSPSDDLVRLMEDLLAKDPRSRIGHADAVAEVLDRCGGVAGQSPESTPASYLYRPGFSGRSAALARIESALGLVRTGGIRVMLVGGESGAGKTRLLMAISAMVHGRGVLVVHGGGSGLATSPLGAFAGVFAAIADRCREQGRSEVNRLLGRRGRVLARFAPSLAQVPEIASFPDPGTLPPLEERTRLLADLAETLKVFVDRRPLVLLMDDLEHADDLSCEAIAFLARSERCRRIPLLVIGTYREGERTPAIDRLLGMARVEPLTLGPLADDAVAEMVSDMMACRPAPAPLASFLCRHGEGNPFFVAEYLRTAVAENVLVRDRRGRWQVAADYDRLPLPGSIRELVERRLAPLASTERALIEAAAVIGREVDPELVADVAGIPADLAVRGLGSLVTHHLLEDSEGERMSFVQGKLRDVCYAGLAREERRRLHRRAAGALERRDTADGGGSGELGRHWQLAGDDDNARRHYLRAARRETARFAHEQAERFYREYLALSKEPSAEVAEALGALGADVLLPLGRLTQAAQVHRRGIEVARAIGDRRHEARALGRLSTALAGLGQWVPAEAACRESLAIFREVGNRHDQATALRNLGAVVGGQGRVAEAIDVFEASVALYRAEGDRALESAVVGNLALAWRQEGYFSKARTLFEDAIAIHREMGDVRMEGIELGYLGVLLFHCGEPERAREAMRRAASLLEQCGDRLALATVLANGASLHGEKDDRTETEALMRRAIALCSETDEKRRGAIATGNLAGRLFAQGRFDEAGRLYAEAFALLDAAGEKRSFAELLVNRAAMARRMGGTAAELLDRAEGLLAGLSHRLGEASVACERGHAFLVARDAPSARTCLERGRELLTGLDLPADDGTTGSLTGLHEAIGAFDQGRETDLLRGELRTSYDAKLLAALLRAS